MNLLTHEWRIRVMFSMGVAFIAFMILPGVEDADLFYKLGKLTGLFMLVYGGTMLKVYFESTQEGRHHES